MPKKINWDSVRQDFIEDNLTYTSVAERHGISRQAVEKRGADERWQTLRQTFQRQQSMMIQSEQDGETFDLDDLLKKAIALSFQQLETAQPRSFEGVVESVCKLSEVYLKIHPPRPPTVGDWVDKAIAFELDLPGLMRKIQTRLEQIDTY